MPVAEIAARRGAPPRRVTRVHNTEIADLFGRYAVLLEIKGENPFRIRAYQNAARTIENLPRDINQMLAEGADLSELPGIGKDLAAKIVDIAETGKFAALEKLKQHMPGHLTDLAELPGLGPKRIKLLFRKLKISSVPELAAAARSGRLHKLRGFGPKTEQKILAAATRRKAGEQRVRLSVAEQVAAPLLDYLRETPGLGHLAIAGSFRRRKETVGDLDILATAADAGAIARFVSYPEAAEILAQGTTKATIRLASGLQVDLRVVPERSYGAALLYFTGSKAHNIALRAIALKRDLKFNEYGVFRGERWLAGRTEAEVYAKAGLSYIAPELRENQGELEAARSGHLPRLVRLEDLKGDLHCHTDASDGQASLEEMARAGRARNYRYLAISDHTRHVGIVHGLDRRRLAQQMAAIDRFNARQRDFRLLKAAEVDILEDGRLAADAGMLRELDLVVAAIHTGFAFPAQTERLIRAMDNPRVNIIAHPTGRLLGTRPAYELDMKRLMRAAAERGCVLEINAQPNRLDLSDIHCRMAKQMGVRLAISTDAHNPDTLDCMRFGVDQARRGWLEASDVINTASLPALLKSLKR